jgi:hypothetical protein
MQSYFAITAFLRRLILRQSCANSFVNQASMGKQHPFPEKSSRPVTMGPQNRHSLCGTTKTAKREETS